MDNIPDGYTYQRCDIYTPKEFLAMYKSRSARQACKEYIAEHPKEHYNTDDEIAIHNMLNDRRVTSLKETYNKNTTKRFKFPE